MRIVSNSSVLINLARIGKLDLLHELYVLRKDHLCTSGKRFVDMVMFG
jgi:predicted nucleic acid-binding protein